MITSFVLLANQTDHLYLDESAGNNTLSSHTDDGALNFLSLPVVFLGVLLVTALFGSLLWFVYIFFLYLYRLKKCRIERQQLRAHGVRTGDDQLFEQELYRSTYRGARFDQINITTGQVRVNDNGHNLAANYLLNNWDSCNSLPSGYENNCTICISPLFPQLIREAVRSDIERGEPKQDDDELKEDDDSLNMYPSNGIAPFSQNDNTQQGVGIDSVSIDSGQIDIFDTNKPLPSAATAAAATTTGLPSSVVGGTMCLSDTGPVPSASSSSCGLSTKLEPVQLPCGHIFHECCIRNWAVYHDNCPNCRFKPTAYGHFNTSPAADAMVPIQSRIPDITSSRHDSLVNNNNSNNNNNNNGHTTNNYQSSANHC